MAQAAGPDSGDASRGATASLPWQFLYLTGLEREPSSTVPAALASITKSSESDRINKSESPAHLLAKAFKMLPPLLTEGRTRHCWDHKQYYRSLAPFRIQRDLLPRLRRNILELAKVMKPKDKMSNNESRAARELLYQISIDATHLYMSVCMTWDPSKFSGSEENLDDLPLFYYPDLPWGVDLVRDSIADLFKLYNNHYVLSKAGSSRAKEGEQAEGIIELLDQMVRDVTSPGSAMLMKWRWMVREIDVMDYALVKFLKCEKAGKNNLLEGVDDDEHLVMEMWFPRDKMSAKQVKLVEHAPPIFRLSRLLLNKLSRPINNRPALTWKMTTKELNKLYTATDMIEDDLRIFARAVLEVNRKRAGWVLKEISKTLKKGPQLLSKHFDSLKHDADQTHIQNGKEWCQGWLAHLDVVVERFIDCCDLDDGLEDPDEWETSEFDSEQAHSDDSD
ncbi:hypothetical protein PCANC_09910 [Puccinia coronata f. sp. avenae]|uniref:Uncharacterized protein n=1 Tax=Puccinia coronata f. sp. avenae TaxID=200324 RepID=A0A2N5UXE7_9BASI|nr:hypothetical protein PCANC_09910 [Puccinia coronata f. sp. avenae]